MNAPHEKGSNATKLSRRAESLGTENAFVVLAEVNALVRQGKDIVSFCIGQPDFPPRSTSRTRASRRSRPASTGTRLPPESTSCAPRRRKTSARGAASTFLPDDVVVGAGAKPFIAYTIASVTDYGAGDEVIYPVPGFPIYESQILANGAVPVPIYLREARDFAFDPAELEAKITPQTKLLILNTPHNPTGGMLQPADLDEIAAILARHPQVWVFADEIYSRLAYAGAFDSIARRPGMLERTIISDGASKTWAMTGWRIGFVANRALAPVFTRWVTNTDSCASQISQWAAVEAITGPQDAADAMRASFLERRDLIVGLLNTRAGRRLPQSRRRFLRVAERHQGVPHHRLCRLGGVAQAAADRGRRRRALRHPLRPPRSRRGTAHPLLLRGVARGDRQRHRAHRRVRPAAREVGAAVSSSLANNRAARDATLERVRSALGKKGDRAEARGAAEAYVAAPRAGTRPAMPSGLVERFIHRATDMESTVERIGDRSEIPTMVARYIDALVLPPAIDAQRSKAGVCWPEFADLDWRGAGLAIEARPTAGQDRLGITGSVLRRRRDRHAGRARRCRYADCDRAARRHAHRRRAQRPRRIRDGGGVRVAAARARPLAARVNFISGPSRTGDIEQTIVLGAHGPFRVHILVQG